MLFMCILTMLVIYSCGLSFGQLTDIPKTVIEKLYTVQIKASLVPLTQADFTRNTGHVAKVEKGNNEYYRYVVGTFINISEANIVRNELIEGGYTDAFVRLSKLDDYLSQSNMRSTTPSKIRADEAEMFYTIQIIAMKGPLNKNFLDNLTGDVVRVSSGDDGFTRYTTHPSLNLTEAKKQLILVQDMGYRDAFIKKISGISNYYTTR